ncbi:hypothetical protein [Burkholderia metallica]|uniref:hypothetical protein n=1 Tax=Burkholderia metallica TaxID=488729 RepID=UPI001575ABD6|nr:hypothetical protein [Burkholderia metallica]NTZ09182.1 hypothetical protein [Burkholderia metallica]
MSRLFAGCLMAASFVATGDAGAACNFVNSKAELIVDIALKPEYHVAPGTAIGTVLADVSVPTDAVSFARCGAPGQSNRSVYGGARIGSSVTPDTFATGIPGIGLAFYGRQAGNSAIRYWGAGDGGAYAGDWG